MADEGGGRVATKASEVEGAKKPKSTKKKEREKRKKKRVMKPMDPSQAHHVRTSTTPPSSKKKIVAGTQKKQMGREGEKERKSVTTASCQTPKQAPPLFRNQRDDSQNEFVLLYICEAMGERESKCFVTEKDEHTEAESEKRERRRGGKGLHSINRKQRKKLGSPASTEIESGEGEEKNSKKAEGNTLLSTLTRT